MRQLKYLLLGLAFVFGCEKPPEAGETETHPYPGVRYIHRHVKDPREIDMHIVIVDLKKPGVTIKTTGPNDDPNTETNFETTLDFVKRCHAQIGINGGFFGYNTKSRILGKGDLVSLAVSDGTKVSPWGGQKDAVNIAADNTVTFIKQPKDDQSGYGTEPKADLYNAVSGNVRLIKEGKVLAKGGNPRYPQTAVGHTADHQLILFVSDGRQENFSVGMTYEELAHIFQEFGAVDAIAFDGGGSATMVMADPETAEPKVLNRPSDGSERAVGNNLAVIIPFGPDKH